MIDTPEIAAMVLTELPAQRRAEYQEAFASCERAAVAVFEAEQRLLGAIGAHEALAHRAAQDGNVPAKESVAANAAIRDAETHLKFAKATIERAEALKVAADKRLMHAHGESYRAVLNAGIDLRIEASARITEAQGLLMKAQSDFARGTALVMHAINRGASVDLPSGGPLGIRGYVPPESRGEAAERRLWGRPAEPVAMAAE